MGTSSVLQCVNGRLEIKRLRYAAVYWRTLDGLQLLCSLVVDSITSPCIETVERGFPANLISEITNHCVLDHLNLISVACKDHNTLLPPCSASISPPPFPPCCCRSPKIRGRRKSMLTKLGSRPGGVKRMRSIADSGQMTL